MINLLSTGNKKSFIEILITLKVDLICMFVHTLYTYNQPSATVQFFFASSGVLHSTLRLVSVIKKKRRNVIIDVHRERNDQRFSARMSER